MKDTISIKGSGEMQHESYLCLRFYYKSKEAATNKTNSGLG